MNALEITELTKTYAGGVTALNGVSLRVAEGDFFALLGPNGAGKSTTINIIISLVLKTGGKVSLFGIDIDKDFATAKMNVGVVPQEFNFNMFEKVKNVVIQQAGYYGLPIRLAKARTEKYLKKLELWDKRDEMAKNLSGGMKRRLMIARALVHEPRMLILDEPTAGVDVELRRSMWEFLREINANGTTIILTTHYLEEAEQLCRNIAIINHGSIVIDTDMKSMLSRIDQETYQLELCQPLTSLPDLPCYAIHQVDESRVEVTVSKKMSLSELVECFKAKGIEIKRMTTKSNRLEELFVELTTKQGEVA